MKKTTLILSLCIAIYSQVSFQNPSAQANDILDYWYAKDLEESYVKIMQSKAGSHFGRIVKSAEPTFVDKVMLKNMVYNEEEKHWEGTLMPPHRNIEVNATFKLRSEQVLEVEGRVFLITKNYTWERSEEQIIN
jgi:hypothetical protein